ncbi:isoprenylcysteine carboxylmethyltransferase family protein [Candidatus Thorarchaeota archaeon]|nr:MAG: isoprenylcysteine carboxylmethyltransferase family protein [Candidatus Thorarchaeota archaeon]
MSTLLEYVWIILGSTLFGLQHSGLSHLPVKHRIIERWGKSGYALIFKMTSAAALAVAFLSMWFWDWLYFLNFTLVNWFSIFFGAMLIVFGLVVSAAASQIISVSTVADMRADRQPELITHGIYSRIRHPLYLATVAIFSGLALLYPFPRVIVFSIAMSAYTIIGAVLEERKLIIQYGESYEEYKNQAGFLLPHLR